MTNTDTVAQTLYATADKNSRVNFQPFFGYQLVPVDAFTAARSRSFGFRHLPWTRQLLCLLSNNSFHRPSKTSSNQLLHKTLNINSDLNQINKNSPTKFPNIQQHSNKITKTPENHIQMPIKSSQTPSRNNHQRPTRSRHSTQKVHYP